jgi:hypothetical protein
MVKPFRCLRLGLTLSSICIRQGQASSEQQPADASKDALKNLESNPSHILDKEAEKKTSKD